MKTVEIIWNNRHLFISGMFYARRSATFLQPPEPEKFVLWKVEEWLEDVTEELSEHWDEFEELAVEICCSKRLQDK